MTIHLELPRDRQALRLSGALQERLQNLLDLQDAQGGLTSQERREAEGLVQFVAMLALVRLRADAAQTRSA